MISSNIPQMRVFLILMGLLLLGFAVGDAVYEDEDSRCNFFCTFQPPPQEPINLDPYRNLSCTHLIYGPAEIGGMLEIKTPSTYDLTERSNIGNYDKLREWRSFKNPIRKLYLGVYSDRKMHLISNEWTQGVFTKNLLEHLRLHHFDGFLLYSDGTETWTSNMKQFLLHFREQQKINNQTVEIFLSLPARLIGTARPILRDLEPLIDGLYLVTDDNSATENPNIAVSVDPLYPDPPKVPDDDTISENAGQLVYNGFPEDKIIIGLSTWTRGYVLPEGVTSASHGSPVMGLAKGGDTTKRRDGKLAYREICHWTSNTHLDHDNKTETISLVRDKNWYSLVLPEHQSFKSKIRWIAAQNFMGIGLSSLVSDDKSNLCGKGVFPLHQTVSNEFKCKIRRKKREVKGSCVRMCSFQPQVGEIFNYTNFESQWCSHMIILSAELLNVGGVKVNDPVKDNIAAFEAWNVKAKPLLILSVGGMQDATIWRGALSHPTRRTVTVRTILQIVNQYDLDGIDVSWTLSNPETAWDVNYITSFLAELRLAIPNKQLIISITPLFSYNYYIKPENIATSVDFILLQAYKFHSYNHLFTGHHSPLFMNSEVLSDPKMTIEGLSFDWVSRGVPSSKLVIGFSAEGMAMLFQNIRDGGDEIGAPANTFRATQRAGNTGTISQPEICKVLQDNQTRAVFVEELGIPYATRNDQFYAYDNYRSMKLKAAWASLNNLGGIGLHAIEMDNIHGECPEGDPYPMLKSLMKAQICDYCISNNVQKKPNETPKRKCEPDFQVACSYKFPTGNHSLNPDEIPFEHCTEIVIEGAGLNAAGKVGFSGEKSDENLKALSKSNSENGTQPLIASIECQMKEDEFTKLIENPTTAVHEIDAMVKNNQLQGVEIKCDGVITAKNKDLFTKFLTELESALTQGHTGHCAIKISVRIPVYNLRLNETYDIEMLNSLHHVSLESFQTAFSESQVVSPLFTVPNDEQSAIDTTITEWLKQGLKREVILMHIPAYGIIQHLSPDVRTEAVGESVAKDFIQIVSQKDICTKLEGQRLQKKLAYDYIASYTINPQTNEWFAYENQATITYKMKYAIREGLAGVGLMSLNDDDNESVCKQGVFPLLHAINRNVCTSA